MGETRRKLVLDLDTGIDDALALVYALGRDDVDLVGVMGSFGNVDVATGVRNTLAVLDLFGCPDVPVYPGADRALAAAEPYRPTASSEFFHGSNGLGGVELPPSGRAPMGMPGEQGAPAETVAVVEQGAPADAAPGTAAPGVGPAPTNPAVEFLLEMVRTHGDDLVYVATGPLTNLALALRREPALVRDLRHATFMGGALTVPGNTTPFAEANAAGDPEAADEVLRSGLPVTMVGLDVTERTVLSPQEVAGWRGMGGPRASFLAGVCDFYLARSAEEGQEPMGCYLHDPLAVGAALDPTLVRVLPANLKVELDGPSRGRTIRDERRLLEAGGSCAAAVGVDAPRFLEGFLGGVGRALAR